MELDTPAVEGPVHPAEPGETNFVPVDRFTLLHGAAGYVMGRMGVPFHYAVVLGLLWEVVERKLKRIYPTYFPNPTQDSPVNMILDVLAVTAGAWYGGSR